MVRKQGGLIETFQANVNVIDRCLEKIREVEPDSLADKIFQITLKTDAYTKFEMDGYDYITDGNGNFSSVAFAGSTTPEIRDLRFPTGTEKDIVVRFMY